MNRLEMINNFAIEIEKDRVQMGLSQRQMAHKLDLSINAYRSLINCETHKIDVFTFAKLYEITGKLAYEYLGYDDRKLKIVSKLNELTEQQLLFIHSIVEYERLFKIEHPNNCDDYITMYTPTGDMQDGMIYDSNHVDKINISKYRDRYGSSIHYAIKITSSHLTPVYQDGDILLISKEPIRDGDIGLFLNKIDGRLYIRKFKHGTVCRLEPLNNYGIEFEISKENNDKWIRFGKILTKMR